MALTYVYTSSNEEEFPSGTQTFETYAALKEWQQSLSSSQRSYVVSVAISGKATDTDASAAFTYFNLTSIDVTGWDTSNVTDLSYLFNNKTKLTTITGINDIDTSSLQRIANCFDGCTKLVSLDLSNWDVSKVGTSSEYEGEYDGDYVFNDCTSLTSLNISTWSFDNCTRFSSFLRDCSSLTTIDVSNFKPNSKYAIYQNMFEGCTSLTTITGLDKWKMTGYAYITAMFKDCTSLVTLPGISSWTVTPALKVNDNYTFYFTDVFSGCTGLTELDVSNWNLSAIYHFDGPFYNCSSLVTLNLGNAMTDSSENPNIDEAFYNCSSLTTIYCNKSWTTSKSENAFYNCTNLPNWDGTVDGTKAKPTDLGGYFTRITYTITYETNGGTMSGSYPTTYQGGIGCTLPTSSQITKDDDTFDGWYLTSSYTQKRTNITANDYGNKTVYAKWITFIPKKLYIKDGVSTFPNDLIGYQYLPFALGNSDSVIYDVQRTSAGIVEEDPDLSATKVYDNGVRLGMKKPDKYTVANRMLDFNNIDFFEYLGHSPEEDQMWLCVFKYRTNYKISNYDTIICYVGDKYRSSNQWKIESYDGSASKVVYVEDDEDWHTEYFVLDMPYNQTRSGIGAGSDTGTLRFLRQCSSDDDDAYVEYKDIMFINITKINIDMELDIPVEGDPDDTYEGFVNEFPLDYYQSRQHFGEKYYTCAKTHTTLPYLNISDQFLDLTSVAATESSWSLDRDDTNPKWFHTDEDIALFTSGSVGKQFNFAYTDTPMGPYAITTTGSLVVKDLHAYRPEVFEEQTYGVIRNFYNNKVYIAKNPACCVYTSSDDLTYFNVYDPNFEEDFADIEFAYSIYDAAGDDGLKFKINNTYYKPTTPLT